MKRLALLLLGIALVLVQGVLAPRLMGQAWMPHILLIISLCVTLLKGRSVGLPLAAVSGIIQDVLIANYFGIHLVSYVAVAYIYGIFSHSIYEEQWYVTAWWMGVGSLATMCIQVLLLWIVQEPIQWWMYIWEHGIPAVIIDAALGAYVHKRLWALEERDEYMW